MRVRVCCVDERDGTGTGGEPSGRIKSGGNSTRAGASRAVLSELLGGVEGEQVQVELPAVRVLFELFGFLLSGNERLWCLRRRGGRSDTGSDLRLQCSRT